jgi:membrane-associated phospholipid phosphatase
MSSSLSRRCRPLLARAFPIVGVILLVIATAVALDGRVAAGASSWKHAVLDRVVGTLNPVGSGVTLLVVCAGFGLVGRVQRRSTLHEAAWLGAVTFMVAGLVEYGLKHLVGRPRPDAVLDVDSFPSGHATSVFAVATVFAAFYPRLRWPLYVLAAAVAAGRVYLLRHYVSDVLAGAVIGIVIASLLLQRREELTRWTCLPRSAGALEDPNAAGGAVELHVIPVAQAPRRVADADDGGQSILAGEDRGVREQSSHLGDQTAHEGKDGGQRRLDRREDRDRLLGEMPDIVR